MSQTVTAGSGTPQAKELIERAASIRATLENNAEETDRLRHLPDANVRALQETGLCRLMMPKRLGGYETDIRTYIEVIAELGRGCGSTAWTASLLNVCAWLTSLFPERAQREVWGSNPDAWVAGSLAPKGDARQKDGGQKDGGWLVSGRWPWASGCLHAQWAACGILMKNEKGEMANLGLSLIPMTDLIIEDTWHMAGMKGTGSNTIVAKDVFVPQHRFLPYPGAFQGVYRTEFKDEALYRAAFVPFTILILIGSQLGVAKAALDFTIANASKRGVTHTHFAKQSESAGFQMQVAEAAMRIESAYLHAFRAADDLDRDAAASRHPDLTARARVRADAALVAKYCREAVDLLVSAHGTSSLADSNRLQRLWRDIHVASHHAITEWQVNLEIYGKALLGVEPNITPLI
jgi:3-hydroxy-9,10-secoandrosta-1,3,5(10)-triene-9,17-dione monooxygenase